MIRRARIVLVLLAALAAWPASAGASAPQLAITNPTMWRAINSPAPVFRGTSSEGGFEDFLTEPVTVQVYRGPTAAGEPVESASSGPEPGHEWEAGTPKPLLDGIYTAEAEQQQSVGLHERGTSKAVTFVIDTVPPQVAISSPGSASSTTGEAQLFAGSAGTQPAPGGDLAAVTLEIFAGSAIGSQSPLQTYTVQVAGGRWSIPVGGLPAGTYIARAAQSDEAGNRGISAPVTFTFAALGPGASPPLAVSFGWIPQAPTVGQSVALISSSTDAASPITSFAWDLAGNGQFKPGGPVLTTSFSTPGRHTVRLRVGDARGATATAAETITVSPTPLSLMQPFPIVRIAGTETGAGVNLSQLTVQAPVGTRVTVSCRGPGCRRSTQSRIARASRRARRASSVVLAFPRFQRSLRAGVVLEIRVVRAGQIGKYTRFAIRRHRLPARLDACLASTDPRPIACPA